MSGSNVQFAIYNRRAQWKRWVGYALAALVLGWLLWAGRGIWFPVSIAFVIAMVLDPTVDRLENRGCSRGLGTALVFLLFVAITVVVVVLLSPGISDQAAGMARDLGKLFPDPEKPNLVPVTKKILGKLDTHPILRDALVHAAQRGTQHLTKTLQSASEWVLAWAPNLVWFLIVPFLSFYMLMDFHRIYAKAMLLVPANQRHSTQTLVAEITAVFGKYVRGMGILCALLGFSLAGLLWAFHNPYWQLLGLLGGLLYAVPVAGPGFTLVLVVLITLVDGTPGRALAEGAAVFTLNTVVFDQIVTPRVLGRQVGLHPLLTILALLLGYEVAGIVGMLVAVPIAASAQLVVIYLIPKLGQDLEIRPLEELKQAEEETRSEHLRTEEEMQDEHCHLQGVIENVEGKHAA